MSPLLYKEWPISLNQIAAGQPLYREAVYPEKNYYATSLSPISRADLITQLLYWQNHVYTGGFAKMQILPDQA